MTQTTEQHQERHAVTQADRVAASRYTKLIADHRWSQHAILNGAVDNTSVVQAFAGHRIAAEAAQAARIAELEAANYLLAAGSCDVEGGKIGDEHGNFYCTKVAKITELEQDLRSSMTETPTIPKGFTAHDGGPCPVHPKTIVDVLFEDEDVAEACTAEDWSIGKCDWWQHQADTDCFNIIAYKVTTPYAEPTDWRAIAEELVEPLKAASWLLDHPSLTGLVKRDVDQALAKYNAAKDKT